MASQCRQAIMSHNSRDHVSFIHLHQNGSKEKKYKHTNKKQYKKLTNHTLCTFTEHYNIDKMCRPNFRMYFCCDVAIPPKKITSPKFRIFGDALFLQQKVWLVCEKTVLYYLVVICQRWTQPCILHFRSDAQMHRIVEMHALLCLS